VGCEEHLSLLKDEYRIPFERRGREDDAEDAENKQPNFGFLFCGLCESFALSAFKKLNFRI
jgi:hypothetical protein